MKTVAKIKRREEHQQQQKMAIFITHNKIYILYEWWECEREYLWPIECTKEGISRHMNSHYFHHRYDKLDTYFTLFVHKYEIIRETLMDIKK